MRESSSRTGRPQAALDLARGAPADRFSIRGAAQTPRPCAARRCSSSADRRMPFAHSSSAKCGSTTRPAILANQRMIWNGFKQLSAGDTAAAHGRSHRRRLAGASARSRPRRQRPPARAARMARDLHGPPGRGRLAGGAARRDSAQRTFPTQIALLLPLSSAAASAALAIRDGFIAAHLQGRLRRDEHPPVYDTTQARRSSRLICARSSRARTSSSDRCCVTEVDQVIAQAGFVPTLALNFAQTESQVLTQFLPIRARSCRTRHAQSRDTPPPRAPRLRLRWYRATSAATRSWQAFAPSSKRAAASSSTSGATILRCRISHRRSRDC